MLDRAPKNPERLKFLPPDDTENPLLDKKNIEKLTERVKGMREGLELRRKALKEETEREAAERRKQEDNKALEDTVASLHADALAAEQRGDVTFAKKLKEASKALAKRLKAEGGIEEQMTEHGVIDFENKKFIPEEEMDQADAKENMEESVKKVRSFIRKYEDQGLGTISDAVLKEHKRRETELKSGTQSIPKTKSPLEKMLRGLNAKELENIALGLTEEARERNKMRDTGQKEPLIQVLEKELQNEVSKKNKEAQFPLSMESLTAKVAEIGKEKNVAIKKIINTSPAITPEKRKAVLETINGVRKTYRDLPARYRAFFVGALLSGIALTGGLITLQNLEKDFQKTEISKVTKTTPNAKGDSIVAGKPTLGGFDFEYYYPNRTPGAPAFKYTRTETAPLSEQIFNKPILVKSEDRAKGLWGIIQDKLTEAKIIDESTSQGKINRIISFLENELRKLDVNELKKLGFVSGKIGTIHKGEMLDLSILDKNGWVKHIRLFK